MNIRTFAVILGGVALIPLAACKVTATGGTGGGTTGSGGATSTATTGDTTTSAATTGTGVGGATATASATATGSTGTGMCDMNYKCAAAIDPMTGDPKQLCDGTPSAMKYDALTTCTCTGNCMAKCGTNTCMGMDITAECKSCITDADANGGCGTEFMDCANDI
jgi:hypothetical protein